jgi:hypothetical protein
VGLIAMGINLEVIRGTYEGSPEDNGRNLLAALAPDAEWTEAEGFPYAGTYVSGRSPPLRTRSTALPGRCRSG